VTHQLYDVVYTVHYAVGPLGSSAILRLNATTGQRVDKKLSCRKEAARFFMSWNISPSQSRSLEMGPFDRSYTSLYWRSLTMALSCIISEIKRCLYLPFYTHSTPPLGGGLPSEYCHLGLVRKTRMVWTGYPMDGEKNWGYDYSFWYNTRTWRSIHHIFIEKLTKRNSVQYDGKISLQ